MQIFQSIKAWREFRNSLDSTILIGFVPTMGALHEGHISLIKAAKLQSKLLVCSIFVNPIQFNDTSDFEKYPISTEQDLKMLQEAGCDAVFLPSVQEMYPQNTIVKMSFGTMETTMEGEKRIGHFSGVGVVVAKLFNIIQPQKAFFGEKDWQQLAIIRQMVYDLSFPIEIIACPTVREADGLAMSSRNRRLSSTQRQEATCLYQSLQIGAKVLQEKDVKEAQQAMQDFLATKKVQLDYIAFADAANMQLIATKQNTPQIVICIAAYLGEIRLIDNLKVFLE
jgi:pantoate--beta-alanine ligase